MGPKAGRLGGAGKRYVTLSAAQAPGFAARPNPSSAPIAMPPMVLRISVPTAMTQLSFHLSSLAANEPNHLRTAQAILRAGHHSSRGPRASTQFECRFQLGPGDENTCRRRAAAPPADTPAPGTWSAPC